MGYACPVCADPQADAAHLANHLAFTALLRGGDHEAWLDDHVPDWADRDEEALGEAVASHVEETDFPQVFADTTESHDHAETLPEGVRTGESAGDLTEAAGGDLDGEAADVLAEARELTRERRSESETE
jgi:hypothetical protein